ncbi:hypothetical protein [Candidatus Ruminimicrobiellum ovillum]|uniref:hypothetical protein n=1 Tax=Candidatus Ruminimicrobiellum ovillum TaxID=1947927 RepID=UPI003559BA99
MADKDIKTQETWMPTFTWLCKSFLVITVFLVITFFSLNFLLKPYMRDIPSEITPWLEKNPQQTEIAVEDNNLNK